MAKKKEEVLPENPVEKNPEAGLKIKEESQPVKVAFIAGKTVAKYKLSEEEIEDVVATYLGVHPKFVLWGGYDCKVLLDDVARAGYNFNGFLPCLKRIGAI